MPTASLDERASLRFVLRLAAVSVVIIAVVLVWTRGGSRQLRVEARMPELRAAAERGRVPLAALIAVAVAEEYRAEPRPVGALAAALGRALVRSNGDEAAALHLVFPEAKEAAMTVDLLARNRARWDRLSQ